MLNNRRGQIGETLTWVIATIVIIIILTISVFVVSSSPFKGMRKFKEGGTSDLLVTKSFVGYLLSDGVYWELKDKENPIINKNSFSDFDKKLSKNIFLNLYNKDYPDYLWMGVVFTDLGSEDYESFFGNSRYKCKTEVVATYKDICITEQIRLDDIKKIEFIGANRE